MNDSRNYGWNLGGWIGAQLGSTCWLLVGAAVLLFHSPLIALGWLVCFILPNAVGLYLWSCHGVLRCYAAMQILFLCSGLCSLLASIMLLLQPEVGATLGWQGLYKACLVFPIAMAWIALREFQAKREFQNQNRAEQQA